MTLVFAEIMKPLSGVQALIVQNVIRKVNSVRVVILARRDGRNRISWPDGLPADIRAKEGKMLNSVLDVMI